MDSQGREASCGYARSHIRLCALATLCALAALFACAADASGFASQLKRYPYLTDVVGSSAAVNWATDRSATTAVGQVGRRGHRVLHGTHDERRENVDRRGHGVAVPVGGAAHPDAEHRVLLPRLRAVGSQPESTCSAPTPRRASRRSRPTARPPRHLRRARRLGQVPTPTAPTPTRPADEPASPERRALRGHAPATTPTSRAARPTTATSSRPAPTSAACSAAFWTCPGARSRSLHARQPRPQHAMPQHLAAPCTAVALRRQWALQDDPTAA